MPEAFKADLHLHSNASDGVLSPGEMVRQAAQAGMRVIAMTDHDTAAGVAEAICKGKALGITVLPGIELTTGGSEEIHLLGYGIDPDDIEFQAFMNSQLSERCERMRIMLGRLEKLGMAIPVEEFAPKDTGPGFMGRMNLARSMVTHGYVSTVREAFALYLDVGKPIYVPRVRIETSGGIELLRSFGAVVCLAHPGRMRMDRQIFGVRLPIWMEAGLEGLEAYHASHTDAEAFFYDKAAREKGLLVTGGSDCHGKAGESAWIGDHASAWRTMESDVLSLMERMERTKA